MENYKIKLAVATMILSACVAAQPVAASAEEPDAALPPESAHQGQESAGEDEKQMAETADTAVAVIPESDASDTEETTAEEMVEEETAEVEAAEEEAIEEETAEEAPAEEETTAEVTTEEEITEEVPAEEEIAEEETAEEDTTAEEITEEATTEEGTTEEVPAEEETAGEETAEETSAEEASADEETTKEETAVEEATEEVPAEEETSEEATPEEVVAEDNTAVPAGPMRAPSSTNNEIGLADTSENEPEDSSVAHITTKDENGNETKTTYNSFDEAVEAAKDGDTIVLTKDAETAGLNLSKNLTVQGTITKNTVIKTDDNGNEIEETVEKKTKLTFTDKGIALWGKNLTFKDMEVEMKDVGSTPYTAEWNWMTICASKNASLTLDNTDMLMDGANAGNKHAIYFCSNNKLNIQNGSNLTIKNYQQDALEWDGGDGGYNVNITDSTFTSDHNRSGFTGTFYATIDNSTVNVVNSTGNGSNGSHFIITDSVVDFSNNRAHGLSTGNLTVDDSTITANGNGLTGVIINGTGKVEDSTITIQNTKGDYSYWSAGLRLYTSATTLDVKNSTLDIQGNEVSGIFCDANTSLTIDDASKVTICYNNAAQKNLSTKKELAQKGGGLLIRSGATVTLGANTVINNNHALIAGDDIFMETGGKLILSKALGTLFDEACLKLDENGNVIGDSIDGWYIDAEGARWDFHGDKNYVIHLDDLKENYPKATIIAEGKDGKNFYIVQDENGKYYVVESYYYENKDGTYYIKGEDGFSLVKNADGTYSITAGTDGFALKAAHAEPPKKPEEPGTDEPGTDDPSPVTPVIPIVKPEDPKAPVVIEELPAEPEVPVEEISAAPQVKLPQTGQNWALAGLLGAMGTLLASAGFASGKHSKSKRRKDEHEV